MRQIKFKNEVTPEQQLSLFIATARQFGNTVTRLLSAKEEGVKIYKVNYILDGETCTLVMKLSGEVQMAADLLLDREGVKLS